MLGFCVTAPLADAVAKLLGDTVPLLVLITVRFLFQALVLLPLMGSGGRSLRLSPGLWRPVALRTLLHITGIGFMFTSLRYLPLAEAVAIAFVMPFIMLLLGRFVLNEEVGMRRLAACGVGFIGTMLVMQPSFAQAGWPATLPLLVAVNFAFFMLVTRTIAKAIDPITIQCVSGFMASALMVPLTLIAAIAWPMPLSVPSINITVLLLLMGCLGTGGHLLMTWSLRYAPSATLAPMQYLEIPFATAIGWLVFKDFPNGLALIGIAITIASGLYIIFRERQAARAAAP